MIQIKNQIVGDTSKRTFSGTNPCLYITVHETANKADGATAQAHANLQSKYGSGGSWHIQVDDIEAIRSYPDSARCWHAGDGKGNGNMSSIGIEICVNLDESREKQIEAYKNAAKVVAKLMIEHSIPLSRVVQHNHFSSFQKNCPTLLREGKYWSWSDFLVAVAAYAAGKIVGDEIEAAKPKPPSKPVEKDELDEDGWWGKATTHELQTVFGTPADSIVSSQNVRWEDDNPALTSGWDWVDPEDAQGSKLIGAMQDWMGSEYKGKKDRLVGPEFFKGLQRKLKKIGYYDGSIDGELWKASKTVKGLQRALNDGKIKK